LKGPNMFTSQAVSLIVSYTVYRNFHRNHPVTPFLYNNDGR